MVLRKLHWNLVCSIRHYVALGLSIDEAVDKVRKEMNLFARGITIRVDRSEGFPNLVVGFNGEEVTCDTPVTRQ